MAFIRSYSQRAMAQDMGDPGRRKRGGFFKRAFKPPRALRKFQPGRAAMRLAPSLLSFVPIPGMSGLMGRLSAIGQKYGISGEQVASFAQSRGIDLSSMGDAPDWDIGDPGARTPKRKRAASGGKAKSQSKKERKASRTGTIGKGRKPSGAKRGIDFGKIAAATTSLLPVGRDLADTLASELNVPGFGVGKAPKGFGGGHRRINPANVKAINRSLRRIEGFEKLAHRVMGHKLFKRVRGGIASGHSHRSVRQGHKSGCGCVVCRRSA
jgi:hypothetical protein